MTHSSLFRFAAIGGATALAVVLTAGAAAAQSPPSPHNPQPPTAVQSDPKCAPVHPPAAQGIAPKTAPHARSTEGQAPLAEKLARGDGVLCPPKGIDPEMVAPTPDVGTMPVIPPPGSPGGDPTIQPK